MDIYCIKMLQVYPPPPPKKNKKQNKTKQNKDNNIKTNYKIDEKNNLYSCCIDCGFGKFETDDQKELSDLWKV